MVLILIVVEDGLVLRQSPYLLVRLRSLNPYCSGRWSRTSLQQKLENELISLNPYCSGRWSRTSSTNSRIE